MLFFVLVKESCVSSDGNRKKKMVVYHLGYLFFSFLLSTFMFKKKCEGTCNVYFNLNGNAHKTLNTRSLSIIKVLMGYKAYIFGTSLKA